jgi:hypothetical protein
MGTQMLHVRTRVMEKPQREKTHLYSSSGSGSTRPIEASAVCVTRRRTFENCKCTKQHVAVRLVENEVAARRCCARRRLA